MSSVKPPPSRTIHWSPHNKDQVLLAGQGLRLYNVAPLRSPLTRESTRPDAGGGAAATTSASEAAAGGQRGRRGFKADLLRIDAGMLDDAPLVAAAA
eukprot:gene26841-28786_t